MPEMQGKARSSPYTHPRSGRTAVGRAGIGSRGVGLRPLARSAPQIPKIPCIPVELPLLNSRNDRSSNLANPYPYTVPVSSALTSVSTAPLVPSKQNKARLTTSLPAGTVQHNFKITLPPQTTLRLLIDDGSIAGNPDGTEPIIDNTRYPGLEIRDSSGATLLATALPELTSFQGSLVAGTQPNLAPGTVYRIKASCEHKNPDGTPLTLLVRVMSPNSRTTARSYLLDGLLRWVAKAEVLGQETQW